MTVLTGDGKPRPTYDWLGGTSEIGVYDCADNTEFTPAMHIYFYPTGSTSYCSPPGGYLATTAELDPAWGGTVDVEMDLKLQRFPGTDNGKSLVEAWGFTLNGGVNPCTALGLPMIADSGTTG